MGERVYGGKSLLLWDQKYGAYDFTGTVRSPGEWGAPFRVRLAREDDLEAIFGIEDAGLSIEQEGNDMSSMIQHCWAWMIAGAYDTPLAFVALIRRDDAVEITQLIARGNSDLLAERVAGYVLSMVQAHALERGIPRVVASWQRITDNSERMIEVFRQVGFEVLPSIDDAPDRVLAGWTPDRWVPTEEA